MHLTQSTGSLGRIPWSGNEQWRQVQLSFSRVIERYAVAMSPLVDIARDIASDIHALDPRMAELCASTCTFCPEPCCLHARVWFDYCDLLYLYLTAAPVPGAQPMGRHSNVCSYWRPEGCRISRHLRPWVCTWYLCPAQTARLRSARGSADHEFVSILSQIKLKRRQMEAAFIYLVSGHDIRFN